jgi:hypothetical protein
VGLVIVIVPSVDKGTQVVDLTGDSQDCQPVSLGHVSLQQDQLLDQREMVRHALKCLAPGVLDDIEARQKAQRERVSFRRLADFLLNLIRKSHA